MIDYEKRIITGKSGKIYRIVPEIISAGRAPEFEIRSILLGYKTDFETLLKTINEIENILIKGPDNAQGNAHKALNKIDDFKKGLINFKLNNRSAIVEFASLYCIGEDEDVSNHSEDVIRYKFADWAHIPEVDFFLLSANAIKGFRESYLNALESQKAKHLE